jgi:hypothetical protein
MPKAGSSTLQDEMRVLARNHQGLFSFKHILPQVCDQLEAENEETLQTFRTLFSNCLESGKSCMLSQEALCQKSQAVKVLVELASGFFDRIEVFFLIRDPAASILSAYQQWGFRDCRISRSINRLIKESGDEDSAILLSSKEWFSILLLKRAIAKQFNAFMVFLNPAELMRSFAEVLHGSRARLSALSFDDSPRDQSLLGSCVERLGSQDIFGPYLPTVPTVANQSFNPFAIEILARHIDTGLFRDPSPISPHDNPLVRKYSSLLDKKLGSALLFDDSLSSYLRELYSVAIEPLRDDFTDDITRGDWTCFNSRSSITELPSWRQIQEVYRNAVQSRAGQIESLHKSQLGKAAKIYKKLTRD